MIAAFVALLVGRGLSTLVATLIVWAVVALLAVVGLGAVGLYVHHQWDTRIAEPYRVEGDVRTTKRLQPEIDIQAKRADLAERRLQIAVDANKQLTQDIEGPGGLREQVRVSNETIAHIEKLAEQARATARRVMAQLAAQTKRDAAEIERLRALANGAPVNDGFNAADQILADLAKWVRQ